MEVVDAECSLDEHDLEHNGVMPSVRAEEELESISSNSRVINDSFEETPTSFESNSDDNNINRNIITAATGASALTQMLLSVHQSNTTTNGAVPAATSSFSERMSKIRAEYLKVQQKEKKMQQTQQKRLTTNRPSIVFLKPAKQGVLVVPKPPSSQNPSGDTTAAVVEAEPEPEKYSGIKMRANERTISSHEMNASMHSRKYIKPSHIYRYVEQELQANNINSYDGISINNNITLSSTVDRDWVTILVLAQRIVVNNNNNNTSSSNNKKRKHDDAAGQTTKQQAKKGSNNSYEIWKMFDMNRTFVSLFLFDAAYVALASSNNKKADAVNDENIDVANANSNNQKPKATQGGDAFTPGSVVAILNPTIMLPKERKGFSLCINHATQICKLGMASEFGICQGTTEGKSCKEAINTSHGLYCEYHMTERIRAAQCERMEVNGGTTLLLGGGSNNRPKHQNLSNGVFTLRDKTNVRMSDLDPAAADAKKAATAALLEQDSNPEAIKRFMSQNSKGALVYQEHLRKEKEAELFAERERKRKEAQRQEAKKQNTSTSTSTSSNSSSNRRKLVSNKDKNKQQQQQAQKPSVVDVLTSSIKKEEVECCPADQFDFLSPKAKKNYKILQAAFQFVPKLGRGAPATTTTTTSSTVSATDTPSTNATKGNDDNDASQLSSKQQPLIAIKVTEEEDAAEERARQIALTLLASKRRRVVETESSSTATESPTSSSSSS